MIKFDENLIRAYVTYKSNNKFEHIKYVRAYFHPKMANFWLQVDIFNSKILDFEKPKFQYLEHSRWHFWKLDKKTIIYQNRMKFRVEWALIWSYCSILGPLKTHCNTVEYKHPHCTSFFENFQDDFSSIQKRL